MILFNKILFKIELNFTSFSERRRDRSRLAVDRRSSGREHFRPHQAGAGRPKSFLSDEDAGTLLARKPQHDHEEDFLWTGEAEKSFIFILNPLLFASESFSPKFVQFRFDG